jgi:hypothetical protein
MIKTVKPIFYPSMQCPLYCSNFLELKQSEQSSYIICLCIQSIMVNLLCVSVFVCLSCLCLCLPRLGKILPLGQIFEGLGHFILIRVTTKKATFWATFNKAIFFTFYINKQFQVLKWFDAITVICVWGKIFYSWMRQNGMKFSCDQKVEFKTSLKLYRQILLEVLMKGGINFVHFAWTKVSEKKARFDIMPKKALFPTNHTNWGKI